MTLALGVVVLAVLAAVWVAVQNAWGRTFGRECADPDVLAGRKGCCGCEQDVDCERGAKR